MKRELLKKFVVTPAAGVLLAINLGAQSYSVNWFTIDGGGGTSMGSLYTVSGTIGQPDAGVMRGGDFSLTGGFWGYPGAASPLPTLHITLASTNAIVSWPNPSTGFDLQETPTLNGPIVSWSNVSQAPTVAGEQKQVIVAPAPGGRFYRLRKP